MSHNYYELLKTVPFRHLYFILGNHDKAGKLTKQLEVDGLAGEATVAKKLMVQIGEQDFYLVHRRTKPTNNYGDVILSCTNSAFRNALESLRARLPKESGCIEEIVLKSSAKPIAYEPEAVFDVRTGSVTMGQGLIKERAEGSYHELAVLPLFSLQVFAYSSCQ